MHDHFRIYKVAGSRYKNMLDDIKVKKPEPEPIEMPTDMVECKKMKARVLPSFCGTHPNCKGCVK